MAVSVFELFKIGIGPSSSHTVGPMRAAYTFSRRLDELNLLARVARVQATLYGSLACTGWGHGTDKAIMLGFSGEQPDSIDPDRIAEDTTRLPYPFQSADELMKLCSQHTMSIAEIMLANEKMWRQVA